MLLAALPSLTGCGSPLLAPIETRAADRPFGAPDRPTRYTVVRGDTLQAIAFRFRVSAADLARWNQLDDPNLIYVGQTLVLLPTNQTSTSARVERSDSAGGTGAGDSARVAANTGESRVVSPAPARVSNESRTRRVSAGAPTFSWPANGKVVRNQSTLGIEAVQILGKRGEPVRAAAAGEVVYSGSGLRGYGELIILKHNDTFLSAYAHNDAVLVNEGAEVSAGEQIARMGSTEAPRVMLHFEIRKNGQAVDPLTYLPKR